MKKPQQIRIIGGEHRRQLIPVLNHEGLRPSSDRVRETVFNWLMHQWGGDFSDKRILDAFAGTGVFGLECISRGASDVLFLDTYAPAIKQIELILTKWQSSSHARQQDACTLQDEPFDWIILDPPFGQAWLPKIIPKLNLLSHADTFLYIEAEKTADLAILHDNGWEYIREGKTQQTQYGLWRRAI